MPSVGRSQWYAQAAAPSVVVTAMRRAGRSPSPRRRRARASASSAGPGRGRRACPARRCADGAERGDRPAVAGVVERPGDRRRPVADGERREERPAQAARLQRAVDEQPRRSARPRPAARNGTGRGRTPVADLRPWSRCRPNDSARQPPRRPDDAAELVRLRQPVHEPAGQNEIGAHQLGGAAEAHLRAASRPATTAGWRRRGTARRAGLAATSARRRSPSPAKRSRRSDGVHRRDVDGDDRWRGVDGAGRPWPAMPRRGRRRGVGGSSSTRTARRCRAVRQRSVAAPR